jgi:hypothetical protein
MTRVFGFFRYAEADGEPASLRTARKGETTKAAFPIRFMKIFLVLFLTWQKNDAANSLAVQHDTAPKT